MTKFNAVGIGFTMKNHRSLSQGEASWGKNYAVCMVGSTQHNSFWVFKLQSQAQRKLILSKTATCTKYLLKNTPNLSMGEMLCFCLIMHDHII